MSCMKPTKKEPRLCYRAPAVSHSKKNESKPQSSNHFVPATSLRCSIYGRIKLSAERSSLPTLQVIVAMAMASFDWSMANGFSRHTFHKIFNSFWFSRDRRLNVFEENNVNSSLFRTLLLRGDIPCQRSFAPKKDNKYGTLLLWKVAPQDLDYCYYLPVFFEGWAVIMKSNCSEE